MNDELIRDIYQRMGRMEAKLDDVVAIREKSDEALSTAHRAEQKSDANAQNIASLSSTLKWSIGTGIPLLLFVLGKIFI